MCRIRNQSDRPCCFRTPALQKACASLSWFFIQFDHSCLLNDHTLLRPHSFATHALLHTIPTLRYTLRQLERWTLLQLSPSPRLRLSSSVANLVSSLRPTSTAPASVVQKMASSCAPAIKKAQHSASLLLVKQCHAVVSSPFSCNIHS